MEAIRGYTKLKFVVFGLCFVFMFVSLSMDYCSERSVLIPTKMMSFKSLINREIKQLHGYTSQLLAPEQRKEMDDVSSVKIKRLLTTTIRSTQQRGSKTGDIITTSSRTRNVATTGISAINNSGNDIELSNSTARPVTRTPDQPNTTVSLKRRTLRCFQLFWGDVDVVLQNATTKNCTFITHNNVIGRTGNQMFQTAAVIGLAHMFDMIPVVKDVTPLSSTFELPNRSNLKLSITRSTGTGSCCQFSKNILKTNPAHNLTISGYLQSFKYFDASDVIRTVFKIHDRLKNDATLFLKSISQHGVQNVGIHIRRGDFVSTRLQKIGFGVASKDYIARAMGHFQHMFSNKVQFIVLSDDIIWCRENLQFDNISIHFSQLKEIGSDLALMTLCDNMIITSGSFGWWGGWLAGGRVVYYTGNPAPGSNVAKEFVLADYYPANWVGLP